MTLTHRAAQFLLSTTKGTGVTYCETVDQPIRVCTNASTMNRLWLFFFFFFSSWHCCMFYPVNSISHILHITLSHFSKHAADFLQCPLCVCQADVVDLTVLKSTQMVFFFLKFSNHSCEDFLERDVTKGQINTLCVW